MPPPSRDHEALIQLFREGPGLIAHLLHGAFDIRLPDTGAQVVEAGLNQLVPTEYRADLVLAVGKVRVIVEVQLQRSEEKRWTWPAYLATLRDRERCQVYLLVVTNSEAVARWARKPIELGSPRSTLELLVLGPESCPRITDLDQARAHPELAILSALLRGRGKDDLKAATAALEAALGLDSPHETFYTDLVLDSVGDAAPQILEALMSISPSGYEYRSEFARKYFQQGKEEGREEGRGEGQLAATAQAVITILSGRGLSITPAQRTSILASTDLARLDHWLRLSISAASVEEMLQG